VSILGSCGAAPLFRQIRLDVVSERADGGDGLLYHLDSDAELAALVFELPFLIDVEPGQIRGKHIQCGAHE
jgi:hypothetical protein